MSVFRDITTGITTNRLSVFILNISQTDGATNYKNSLPERNPWPCMYEVNWSTAVKSYNLHASHFVHTYPHTVGHHCQVGDYATYYKYGIMLHIKSRGLCYILKVGDYATYYKYGIMLHIKSRGLCYILQIGNYATFYKYGIMLHITSRGLCYILQVGDYATY